MTLDTVAMAYPIDRADLLAPVIGDLLVYGSPEMTALFGDHPDLDPYRTVEQTWGCLAGETGALPPTELLGTSVPGDISFTRTGELGDWTDFYADILGPPLDGFQDELRRTPKGTLACAWILSDEPVRTYCKRAATASSAYCSAHPPMTLTVPDPRTPEETSA